MSAAAHILRERHTTAPRESLQSSEDHSTPRYAALTAKAQEGVDEARETVAYSHQLFEQSRNTLKDTKELFQYLQARREREAEQLPPLGISHPLSPLVQASDSPPELLSAGEPSPLTKETT